MEIGDELEDEVVGVVGGTGEDEAASLGGCGGEFAGSVAVAVAEGGGRGIVGEAQLADAAPQVSVIRRALGSHGGRYRTESELCVGSTRFRGIRVRVGIVESLLCEAVKRGKPKGLNIWEWERRKRERERERERGVWTVWDSVFTSVSKAWSEGMTRVQCEYRPYQIPIPATTCEGYYFP